MYHTGKHSTDPTEVEEDHNHQGLADLGLLNPSIMGLHWVETKPGLAKHARCLVLPTKLPSTWGVLQEGPARCRGSE